LQKPHSGARGQAPHAGDDFRADVHAVLGPDSEDQRLVCDITNNLPTVVAVGGFGFDLFFKRDGKTFCLTSDELIRAHRAGLL